MKKGFFRILLIYSMSHLLIYSFAQNVGIGTSMPDPSAILDVQSTSKGILFPRMTTPMIQAIIAPSKGLMVYDSVTNQLMVNLGTSGTGDWKAISVNNNWSLTGNQGANSSIHFIGTTDNHPLHFRYEDIKSGELNPENGSIFWGARSGSYNGSSVNNIGIGNSSLVFLAFNDYQSNLIAIGDSVIQNNSCPEESNPRNIGIGSKSMNWPDCAFDNTALGFWSLASIGSADQNTAIGSYTLSYNLSRSWNTAVGAFSLFGNDEADANSNTGVGRTALQLNDGARNTAAGVDAMFHNDNGNENTVIGTKALQNGEFSDYNTGVGYQTLFEVWDAQYNTAIGYVAGNSYAMGWNNTLVGAETDVSFANQYNTVALGIDVACPDQSMVRIGNSLASSIGGYADWTNISDGQYKNNIQSNVAGLDFITRLHPVNYQLDINKIIQETSEVQGIQREISKPLIHENEDLIYTGFVAQEVEEAAMKTGFSFSGIDHPRNGKGFYGLRYASFVVPLVTSIQELHHENQSLLAELEEQTRLLNDILAELELLEK